MSPQSNLAGSKHKRKLPIDTGDSRKSKRLKSVTPGNERPAQRLDVFVCGDGDNGELGLGVERRNGKTPKWVKSPRLNDLLDFQAVGIVQIAVGGMHCAALSYDSQIFTWGVNDDGALGRDTAINLDLDENENDYDLNPLESTPASIRAEDLGQQHAARIVQVAATDSATFALTSDGKVYGWGAFRVRMFFDDFTYLANTLRSIQGREGMIGFFPFGSLKKGQIQRKPALIPQLKNIVKLAAGGNHILALNRRGAVFAWGDGQQSQLGRHRQQCLRSQDNINTLADYLVPRLVEFPPGGDKVVDIACGAFHSFAITSAGNVYSWGLNNFGQTGVSAGAGKDDAVIEEPTLVKPLSVFSIQQISGGTHHSIAVTDEGEVLTWGRCDDYQLGANIESQPRDRVLRNDRGAPQILLTPTAIPGIRATMVAAGADNSMAISKDGLAFAWGFSANYRTGLGTEAAVAEPTVIKNGILQDRQLSFVGCGGQFSVFAGPAAPERRNQVQT